MRFCDPRKKWLINPDNQTHLRKLLLFVFRTSCLANVQHNLAREKTHNAPQCDFSVKNFREKRLNCCHMRNRKESRWLANIGTYANDKVPLYLAHGRFYTLRILSPYRLWEKSTGDARIRLWKRKKRIRKLVQSTLSQILFIWTANVVCIRM